MFCFGQFRAPFLRCLFPAPLRSPPTPSSLFSVPHPHHYASLCHSQTHTHTHTGKGMEHSSGPAAQLAGAAQKKKQALNKQKGEDAFRMPSTWLVASEKKLMFLIVREIHAEIGK